MNNLIVISDLHAGCMLGLCPPGGVRLDEGGGYSPSLRQQEVWNYWLEFWNEWVPMVTRGEPFDLAVNGDAMDGDHHKSNHQITHNLTIQNDIAAEILEPVVKRAARYYHIRGTEAHSGSSGQEEEKLARRLGAIPNSIGQYARYELKIRVGKALVHVLHHVGTTSSNAYESTAVHKELAEAYTEAGRWGREAPAVIVRGHRHRAFETRMPSIHGYSCSIVTPGWQLKTPFTWRMAGARQSEPQFGGVLVRAGDEDQIYTRAFTRSIDGSEIVE